MKAPIVIGALGGSGTRVIARIAHHAGIFMGTNRNVSEDAMEFVEFYDRWINRFVLDALDGDERAAMTQELCECVTRHRVGLAPADAPWGWKEPRSIYLLPFFHSCFPGLRFIHVVRDGRDMAFSSNQNQLRKHGSAVLGTSKDAKPQPVRTALLWQAINLAAADYGERRLGSRYLRVRFEDLCASPSSVAARICEWVGATPSAAARTEVTPPASIGRWRSPAYHAVIGAVVRCARPALTRFGYDA